MSISKRVSIDEHRESRMWKLLLCIRSQSLSIIISCFQKLPRSHQIKLEAARISSAHKSRFLSVLSSINLSRDVTSTHLHPPFFLNQHDSSSSQQRVFLCSLPLWGIWNRARVFCIIDSPQSRFQRRIVQSNVAFFAFRQLRAVQNKHEFFSFNFSFRSDTCSSRMFVSF